jgi:hypothetical protein
MELLPEEIKTQIPILYSQTGIDDPMVYVTLFTSIKTFAWFIIEFSHEDNDTCFGYIFDHDEGEFGYFSLRGIQEQRPLMSFHTLNAAESSIESTSIDGNVPTVERDQSFIPKRLSAAKAEYLKIFTPSE